MNRPNENDSAVPARLSLCEGEPILNLGTLANLGSSLLRAAREHPTHGITYILADDKELTQTYPELQAESSRIAAGLAKAGVVAGGKVIFQLDQNQDFIPAFWGCIFNQSVAVPVALPPSYDQPHNTVDKLKNAWLAFDRCPILTRRSYVAPIRRLAERISMPGLQILAIEDLRETIATKLVDSAPSEDTALILLTSGSTGMPKGVALSHYNLLCRSAASVQRFAFTAADVSVNWMPLDHVGGIVMFHLRDVYLGANQVHAPTELVLHNPTRWLDWIDRFRATSTWAPNFAYGLLNDQINELAQGKWDLSSMRYAGNGGEAIVARTARKFLQLMARFGFPSTAMKPAWGMSETASGVIFSDRFLLNLTADEDSFVEVGTPLPGFSFRIVDRDNNLLPQGTTGSLQVRGQTVTSGYFRNPKLNAEAFSSEGWFKTGDLGVITNDQLTITGREKDVIIINGVNFYSHEIEAVVEQIPGVDISFTAACAIRAPGENTDRIAIFFCATSAGKSRLSELIKLIRNAVLQNGGILPDYIVPLERLEIPKTNIGKIQRSLLKTRFEQGEFAAHLNLLKPGKASASLSTVTWQQVPLGTRAAAEKRSVLIIDDGDSLTGNVTAKISALGCKHRTIQSQQLDTEAKLASEKNITPFSHVVYILSRASLPNTKEQIASSTRDAMRVARLAQLLSTDEKRTIRLLLVTGAQNRISDREQISFRYAGPAAVARTLEHEYTGLATSIFDLEDDNPTTEAEAVLEELFSAERGEAAWRTGTRFVPSFRPVILRSNAENRRFVHQGVYVITGALGGIAQELALHLATNYQARLILLTRETAAAVPTHVRSNREEIQKDLLSEIRKAGGDAVYFSGQLTDAIFIGDSLDKGASLFGQPVQGVLHLAGEYHETPLASESVAGFLRAAEPKISVALALHEACMERPACWFLYFSSLLGQFGAFGAGAYAAANATLDSFAQYQRSQNINTQSVLWSLWLGKGMGKSGNPDALAARGIKSLSTTEAFLALEEALGSDHSLLFVGLNSAHGSFRRRFLGANSVSPESAVSYLAPETAAEKVLVRIWQDCMGLSQIGVHDDFFELGGRSLIAARIFGRIEKELGKKMPLATLYKAPTIAQLAKLLNSTVKAPATYILAIRKNGTRPPFFCFPGGGSDAMVFEDLAAELGNEQPFYGLQARGLDTSPIDQPFPSLEELASSFVSVLREVQPTGPYYIGGHCFGSLIAWEVAHQLSQSGETIGLLTLIDPIVGEALSTEIVGRDRLKYHFQKFLRLNAFGKLRYAAAKIKNFSRTLLVRRRIESSLAFASSMHQQYAFTEKKFDVKVTVFLADDSFLKISPKSDPRLSYERLATQGTEYLTITGDHHTILHETGVKELGRGLNKALTRAREAQHANTAKEVSAV